MLAERVPHAADEVRSLLGRVAVGEVEVVTVGVGVGVEVGVGVADAVGVGLLLAGGVPVTRMTRLLAE